MQIFHLFFLIFTFSINIQHIDSKTKLNMSELVILDGYPIEEHFVTTDDGYILKIFRIPGKFGSKPILFIHGLLCSSVDWIIMGKNHSLAYMAADFEYDVWIGNNRGNFYSKYHKTYNKNSEEFWDFSWHELGIFDIPAIIDYILKETSQIALFYVGHSQGTTQYLVMASERPEYLSKIKQATLLAPAAFMGQLKSWVTRFAAIHFVPNYGYNRIIGLREISPFRGRFHKLCKFFNADSMPTKYITPLFFHLVFGPNYGEIQIKMQSLIFSHYPAGASSKQFYHYGQLMKKPGRFCKYNYNIMENQKRYNGMAEPPDYQLNRSNVPIAVFYGQNDYLSTPENVNLLLSKLPNCSFISIVMNKNYNHIDYLYGKHANERVYRPLMDILQRFK